MRQTDILYKTLVGCSLQTPSRSLYLYFNCQVLKSHGMLVIFAILQSIPFTFQQSVVPWRLLACPLSNPCIGYPLVRTGLVEPTVSKVVENQKEKVLAVPESILYYTLHFIKRCKQYMLV